MNEETKKYIDEKVEEFKENLIKEIERKQEQKDEFPKYGDKYYYLTIRGNIESAIWTDDEFDRCTLAMGNLFKTEEVAKFERERRKVIAELKKFAEPEERKWNGENDHYYIILDYACIDNDIDNGIRCYYSNSTLKHADIYFESEEKVEQAIRMVGEDRVKKYYLMVE